MMISPNSIPASLPAVSAIYRVWYKDQVVYVGQATNLKQRWRSHHIYKSLYENYGCDWTLDWVPVRPSHLNRAEAFAHRHFKPSLNKQNPSTALGKPETKKQNKISSS